MEKFMQISVYKEVYQSPIRIIDVPTELQAGGFEVYFMPVKGNTNVEDKHIEQISIEFHTVEAGWLRFTMNVGEQSFSDSFSYVFDPLPHLKAWLEAISLGVQQTSFIYNNEGQEFKFNFDAPSWNINRLSIYNVYNPSKDNQSINAIVDRKQMVEAFYKALLKFAHSEKYERRQWERERLKDVLCRHAKATEEEVITKLLGLDREQLDLVLGKAEDPYGITCIFDSDEDTGDKEYSWNMPLDYDQYDSDKKRQYLIESLNEKTFIGYDGMSLIAFQSDIIDGYLSDR